MDVWIARDGVEIGAWRKQDLKGLASLGRVEPTDHYWHAGMGDWEPLETLLGADAWNRPAAPPFSPNKRYALFLAAGICVTVLVIAVVFLWLRAVPFAPVVKEQRQAAAGGPPIRDLSRSDANLRETASAELERIVQKLPRTPAPPLNIFYYALSVTLPPPPGGLIATISGAEDSVDPATQQTRWHTPFILTLEYLNAQWMYQDFRASTTDMNDGTVIEIDGSRKAAIQPTIVSILGVRPAPDRVEHE